MPPDQTLEPITNLLKKHNVGLSAVSANKKLLVAGVLEEKTRASSADPTKTKKFKVLTELGREFGENVVNDLSPETTPKYFAGTFDELVERFLKDS
ncbi:MAG: hypothetical protein HKN70_00760 [Gammaproteobacteria bacterium]|nr:hypothetical protein [Gammaproteobacteria bacterium]